MVKIKKAYNYDDDFMTPCFDISLLGTKINKDLLSWDIPFGLEEKLIREIDTIREDLKEDLQDSKGLKRTQKERDSQKIV